MYFVTSEVYFRLLARRQMSESDSYVGKYSKQRLLGRGTFGEAWLVVSRQSGR